MSDEWKPIEAPLGEIKEHLETIFQGFQVIIDAEKEKALKMLETLKAAQEEKDGDSADR